MSNVVEVGFEKAMTAYKNGEEVFMCINDRMYKFEGDKLIHIEDLPYIEWCLKEDEDV